MGATIIVNNLTVVHKDSGGKAPSVPDFCKTPAPPGPPVPIPYVNVAQSTDTADGSKKVKMDGNPIMLKTSKFSTSKGDEAGTLKGVASNTTSGIAKFVNYSFDVKVEGKNVPRLGDPMTNNGNGANTTTVKELQATTGIQNIDMTDEQVEAICEAFCETQDEYDRGECPYSGPGCCSKALADRLNARNIPGVRSEQFAILSNLGHNLDVPANMIYGAAEMVPTRALTAVASIAASKGIPGGAAVPGWLGRKFAQALSEAVEKAGAHTWGRIPDIVTTIPGSSPPRGEVLDAKFRGDRWRDQQKPDYKRLNNGKDPVTIDNDTCKCT